MKEYKEFSIELYNENDDLAKLYAISFLQNKFGYSLKSIEEVYTYDILMLDKWKNEKRIEVERKTHWIEREFPFDTIHIPYRKIKNVADYFIMFNADYTALLLINMNEIRMAKIVRKNTIYTHNEKFFELSKFKPIYFFRYKNHWYKPSEYYKLLEKQQEVKMEMFI